MLKLPQIKNIKLYFKKSDHVIRLFSNHGSMLAHLGEEAEREVNSRILKYTNTHHFSQFLFYVYLYHNTRAEEKLRKW